MWEAGLFWGMLTTPFGKSCLGCLRCFVSCLPVWGMKFIRIVSINQKSSLILELLLGLLLLFPGQGVIQGANTGAQ